MMWTVTVKGLTNESVFFRAQHMSRLSKLDMNDVDNDIERVNKRERIFQGTAHVNAVQAGHE